MIHLSIDSDGLIVIQRLKNFVFDQFPLRYDPYLDNCPPFWFEKSFCEFVMSLNWQNFKLSNQTPKNLRTKFKEIHKVSTVTCLVLTRST